MGHKVNPLGFRLGVIRDWQAKWYADKHYAEFLQEDLKLRKAIQTKYADAAVSLVAIEREANQVTVTVHTARPGIVIGRGGQRVDEMRHHLEQIIGKRVQLNIQEIQQPGLDAYLVARSVAEQIERRVAYRRAMKQVMQRTIQAGAKGMKVSCAGRLGGAEIARRLTMHEGQVPLHTLRADIDYGFIEARTMMGRIGVKVWIYKGEVLPESKEEELAETSAVPVAEVSPGVTPSEGIEEPPVKRTARRRAKTAATAEPEETPSEPIAEVSAGAVPAAETEKPPVKRTVRRRAKTATTAEPEETPSEPIAEVSAGAVSAAETEKPPVKRTVRRRAKTVTTAEPELSTEAGGNNAAT